MKTDARAARMDSVPFDRGPLIVEREAVSGFPQSAARSVSAPTSHELRGSRLHRLLFAEVSAAGCFRPATARTAGFATFILISYSTAYALLLTAPGIALRLLALGTLSFLSVQAGFLAHEAGHGAITRSRRLARCIGQVFNTLLTALCCSYFQHIHRADHPHCNIMQSQGYHPVVLPVADILPALETGMIDVVPVPPLWALIGQFDRVTRHMVRVNWVPIAGATVLRKQTWDALDPAVRAAISAASRKATQDLRAHRTIQDEESVRAMERRGLTVVPLTPEAERAWRNLGERTWPQVRGSMVPAETFDRVQALLAEYRSQRR